MSESRSGAGAEGRPALSEDAVRAWRATTLAKRIHAPPEEMLIGASEAHVGPGDVLHIVDGGSSLLLAVVVQGLARVYTTTSTGRQVTTRYVTDGDVMGLPSLLAPEVYEHGPILAVQALTVCHVLRLSPTRFRAVIARDAGNMWGLFIELTAFLKTSNQMLAENLFQPVRFRVARHMLDLAERDGSRLIVRASQQDIADAIGSVREVVSRAVVWLRDQGLIVRDGSVYVLTNPAGLHELATSGL